MKKILSSGTKLQGGSYRIEKHLGGGGFGITYLATWFQGYQTNLKFIKTEEKTVVIKEFFYANYCKRADNSNEILITDGEKKLEFERLRKKVVSEANILNSFRHPYIVDVFDVFEENNTAYIVMEYVKGENLEERIISRKKYCHPEEATRYISQIALALKEVHSKHILHLDISPSNIMIDENDNARLIDFGISLVYDDTGGVKQSSKLLAGKKSGFSPPEQNSTASLNRFLPPIDLYALGATLYYALTGQKPPDSGSLSAGSDVLVLPSSYNPQVSDYLDGFVSKAMSIKSSERFQTAADFEDALLNGEKQYTNAVRQGMAHYESGNYQDALLHFEAACKWINTDDDLNQKINRCKLNIAEREKLEETEPLFQPDIPEHTQWFHEFIINPLKTRKMLFLALFGGIAAFLIGVFYFEYPEQWAYEKACRQGTIESYERYLQKYPNGAYKNDIIIPYDRLLLKKGNELSNSKKYPEAAILLHKSAELGNPSAQNSLGYMYRKGLGVQKNDTIAVEWYRRAAEQGHAEAQFSLGYMYSTGSGIPKSIPYAIEWYRRSAEQGYVTAQYNLGYLYETTERDLPEARIWYQMAAEQGHERAIERLAILSN